MVETQAIAFLALAGLMGHALSLVMGGGSASAALGGSDGHSPFWTSERFAQSGDGHERPFFIE